MSNAGVPKGKETLGKGIRAGSKVNESATGKNSMGIPDGQTPGIGKGNKEVSMNQLPSTAKVHYPAKSNLMTGMSQTRGPGGAK